LIPKHPDVRIDTTLMSIEQAADEIETSLLLDQSVENDYD